MSSMSPSATPATQRAAATTASFGNPARHQSRPSAVSATPATQSERRCHQVKIHVAKCHAGHAGQAKRRCMSPSATPATQSEDPCHPCHQVPRLARKVNVDVKLCEDKCVSKLCVDMLCVSKLYVSHAK